MITMLITLLAIAGILLFVSKRSIILEIKIMGGFLIVISILEMVNELVKPSSELFNLSFIILAFGLFLLCWNSMILKITSWLVSKLELR